MYGARADQLNAVDTAPVKQWTALEIQSPDKSLTVDAEAIIELESEPKGTWLHAGYHLTSGTTGPQILSLPFAIAALGWGPGLLILCLGGPVSFYAYYLQATVIDRVASDGKRCQGFRDLSCEVLGRKWSSYLVAPLQFVVCFTTVVSCIVLGGQSMKAIFQGQDLSLYQFTIVFGCVHIILSQLPSLHSLRHLNLLSLLVSVTYCLLAVYSSISAGLSKDAPPKDYSVVGSAAQKWFGAFNSLSILSNIYGNVIMVEIQATIAPPSLGKMVKGLCFCYTIILVTFLPLAISGYWAFGTRCNGNLLLNLFPQANTHYVPNWMCIIVNALIFIQLIVSSLMYSQPTFTILEESIIDINKTGFALRNAISRLLSRSIFTVFATLLAAMLPYFGSINAIIGAIGYTPLVFIIPVIFHIIVFRPSPCSIKFWIHYIMIAIFLIVTILGCLASFRQLVLDANMYHLFANL